MPWAKVKSLNYIPSFRGMENLVTSAIVEFGIANDGVDQVAFAKEIDLLNEVSFTGSFLPLEEIDQTQALSIVANIIGESGLEQLKLKAEITLMQTETLFFSL